MKNTERAHFVTLTFSTPKLIELSTEIQEADKTIYGYKLDNAIATLAVRRFLERWRKKHKKSIRHWLVTELGKEGTEHMHLHGFLWTNQPDQIGPIWGYGFHRLGIYTNERTVAYCVKYVMKIDPKHRYYRPIVLTSAGIGRTYMNSQASKSHRYKPNETNEAYRTRDGQRLSLPKYLRDKLFTEDEREQLRIEKLNSGDTYIS